MTSSTTRAFMAKKQSTFSAVMANSIKNLLQGYTKGIRFVAVLTLLLTMGIGELCGAPSARYFLIGDPTSSWNKDNNYKIQTRYEKDGQYVLYIYASKDCFFRLKKDDGADYGPSSDQSTSQGYGSYNTNAWKYNGNAGIVRFGVDETAGDNGEHYPYVFWEKVDIKIKHGWNGGDWTVQDMIAQSDGTYTYIGQYSGTNGANFGIEGSGATFKYISNATLVGSPQKGHRCLFTYNSSGYKGYGSETQNTGSATITRLYTITYDGNGNTGGTVPAAVDKKHGTNITLSSSSPTKTGYTFTGWNTKQDGSGTSYAKGATYSANADVILYAQWSGKPYTVSFNVNGGSGGTGSVTATYGSPMPAITLPTRVGYAFNGYWTGTTTQSTQYYDANGNSLKNWDKANNTTTLNALWIPNTYTVQFDGNGSTSGSMSNQSFTYDAAKNLTANAFSKTGYTFAGWATSSGGDAVYADKQSVSNLTNVNNGTVTLYAQWTLNTYTVKWFVNGEELTGAATTVAHGNKITTIPEVDLNTYCEGSDVLAGWIAAPMENASVAAPANLYKTIEDFPIVEEPQSYYAVFANYKE